MAENNLLMTIVLVVAATLLFSGGLTGNASYQKNFGFDTTQHSANLGGEVVCSPVNEGRILAGNDAVIVRINEDCSEDIVADCGDSSKPFGTKQRKTVCNELQQSSSTDVFPGVQ